MQRPLIPTSDSLIMKTEDVKFITKDIHVTPHHTEGYWLLLRKQIWELDHDFTFVVLGHRITARKGFLTDFASTPKLLWPIYAPTDSEWNKSVLMHDVLYSGEIFSKRVNDMALACGMSQEGSGGITVFNFYTAVKACGWTAYWAHTDVNVEGARRHIKIAG
jgi:hypothetical protein